jgi:hypothetical protein
MLTSSTTAVCANAIILRNRQSTSRSQQTTMTIPYQSAHFVSHISFRKKRRSKCGVAGRQNARHAQAVDVSKSFGFILAHNMQMVRQVLSRRDRPVDHFCVLPTLPRASAKISKIATATTTASTASTASTTSTMTPTTTPGPSRKRDSPAPRVSPRLVACGGTWRHTSLH